MASLLAKVILSDGGFQAIEFAHGSANRFFRSGALSALVTPELAAPGSGSQSLGFVTLPIFELSLLIGQLNDAIGFASTGGVPLFWCRAACQKQHDEWNGGNDWFHD